MREVVITGVGMTSFGNWIDQPLRTLAHRASSAALADAGISDRDVGTVFHSNCFAGSLQGQESIRGQVTLQGLDLRGAPIINVENACASGATAFNLAWQAVAAGHVEVALAVGVEKMYHEEKARTFAALRTATDVERTEEIALEVGHEGNHSIFMDIYAQMAERHQASSGATEVDYATVVAKNRAHGAVNPCAQFRTRMTVDEVLSSRRITGPLTLPMCAPIGDGAAALVLTTRDKSARIGGECPGVRVLASTLGSGSVGRHGTVPPVARQAYEVAGIGPEDLDVIELHDATAPAELMLYEELALCPEGHGPKLLASGATTLGGRLPVNPSGGLLSRGHPVGATGCAQLVELTYQLRGTAGDRQVPGARIGLAENSGGYLHPDVAVAAVNILASEAA